MQNELLAAAKASLAVGAGGFFGAMARYGVAQALSTPRPGFPWGTFAANLLGCFLIGVLKTWFDRTHVVDPLVSLAILTGFLGAFTTFSTFSFETASWLRTDWRIGVTYLVGSIVLGLLLVTLGMRIGAGVLGR